MRRRPAASWTPLLFFLRGFAGLSRLPPTISARTTDLPALSPHKRYKPRSDVPPDAWKRLLDESTSAAGDDYTFTVDDANEINELCSEFLLEFLEGTTDAKDTCEGIMNAYTAANCKSIENRSDDEDQDDYFGQFYEHDCCQSLLSRHSEYCDEDTLLSNMHLLLAASVLLLCEVAKSLVKRYDVNFLPEAGVCILVGVVVGSFTRIIPGVNIDDMSFDGQLFLMVLLPPIIFEAALTVSKKDFRRRRLAIFMFAVFGTIMSTFVTGYMVHLTSKLLPGDSTLPLLDALIFGALISSIDPVAILSILTSLNLDQKDTIFILVFGESLLNDGVAITMSHVLISRFHERHLSIDESFGAVADFLIVGFGSIAIGFVCALLSMVYFWLFRRLLNPGMEVGSFFLWALIPYWICDGFEWSGIVAIVTAGFFMDIYIASTREMTTVEVVTTDGNNSATLSLPTHESPYGPNRIYAVMSDDSSIGFDTAGTATESAKARRLSTLSIWDLLHKNQRVRLSREADKHVRFVAHLLAQLSENSIFAYLGLFLFSQNYEWDGGLVSIGVASCIAARALMVVTCCFLIWHINVCRRGVPECGYEEVKNVSRTATTLRQRSTQLVLIFAGLRGAVSLALVENVPIYNSVTGEGCEYKPVLKAMTSASIIFTMFVFGGGAYYIFPMLGLQPDDKSTSSVLGSPRDSTDSASIVDMEMSGYHEPPEIPMPRPPPVV